MAKYVIIWHNGDAYVTIRNTL